MTAPNPMRPRRLYAVPDPEPDTTFPVLDILAAAVVSGATCAVIMIAAHDQNWRMTGPAGTAMLAAMVAVGGTYIYRRMSRREQVGR